MPVFLLGIGVFAVAAGLAMVGFGIPINEFSFGNTLINAGTTAAVGGLIIIAVGIAVRQLRLIAGMLADGAHLRLALPADDVEPGAAVRNAPAVAPASALGRPAYPQRPIADPFADEPEPAPMTPAGGRAEQSYAPSLRNPDEGSLTDDDDISLSPRHPQPAPAPAAMPPGSLDRTSDSFDWRVPPQPPGAPSASGAPAAPLRQQPANFDAMWPAEGKPTKGPASGPAAAAPKPEPKVDVIPARRAEPPRTVAILKSGVVDGMGYTLYVDGSIEAELPQGTLRFASINELRSHLEKNS